MAKFKVTRIERKRVVVVVEAASEAEAWFGVSSEDEKTLQEDHQDDEIVNVEAWDETEEETPDADV